jgi:hypothetical protein
VTPNAGGLGGGNQVVINGSSLAAVVSAYVGTVPLTGLVVNANSVTGTITPGAYPAATVNASVIAANTTFSLAGAYTFEAMTFNTINPPGGGVAGNVAVTINGSNFKDIPINGVTLSGGGFTVTLVNLTVNAAFTQLTGTVPGGLPTGPADLSITSTSHGNVTVVGAYTVGTGPSTTYSIFNIDSLPGPSSPAHGPLTGGTTVDLFVQLQGAASVGSIGVSLLFPGGAIEFPIAPLIGVPTLANPTTEITFTTPAAPAGFFGGPVTIRVDTTLQGFTTAANGFTYDPASGVPFVNSVAPSTGPQQGGTLVSVTGVNFRSGALSNVGAVLIGGNPLLGLAVQSNTQLTGVTPVGVAGPQPLVVVNSMGTVSNVTTFTYTPSLILTKVDPNNGPVSGGNVVTVTGQNFTAATVLPGNLLIGGNVVTSISIINTTTLTGIVPAGATLGPVDVVLMPGGGLSGARLVQGYTYGPAFDLPGAGTSEAAGTVLGGTAIGLGTFLGNPTRPDAVTVNSLGGGTFTITPDVKNLGSAPSTTFSGFSMSGPIDVAVADMNGDGQPDIVVLNNNNTISIILNTGSGATWALGANTNLGLATNATSIDVGDVDGDGKIDVVACGGNQAVFCKGNGNGTVTVNAPFGCGGTGAAKIRIAGGSGGSHVCSPTINPDLNGDGNPDLVVANKTTGTVAALLGDGLGGFVLGSVTSCDLATNPSINPVTLVLGDIDENGTLDIITGNAGPGPGAGSISVLAGNGAGGIALLATYVVPGVGQSNVNSIVLGDVNFDCRTDIVFSNYNGANVSVMLGNGDGSFSAAVNYVAQTPNLTANANIVGIAGVYQSDGLSNIVCIDQALGGASSWVTMISRHRADLYFGIPQTPPLFTTTTQTEPDGIVFGDLNGDGRLDMVICNRASSTIQVFIGDGTGNFSTPFAPIPTGAQPESVAVADIRATGQLDLVVACNGINSIALHRNFGGGSFGAGVFTSVGGTGPHQVLINDVNGDGHCDVVTVNQLSNNISILLGDGTGNFNPAFRSPYTVGNAPTSAAIGDLNSDGLPDIVVSNFASDDVSVMLQGPALSLVAGGFGVQNIPLGGTITCAPAIQATQQSVTLSRIEPRAIALGDMNNDGALDIVVACGFTSTVTILHGKQRGVLTLNGLSGGAVFNAGDVLVGPQGATGVPALDNTALERANGAIAGGIATIPVDLLTGSPFHPGGGHIASVPGLAAFFVGQQVTDLNTASTGNVLTLTNIQNTGDFYRPTDYFSDGTTTNIGSPSVILGVGGTPTALKLFDMNSDGFLDIVTGDFQSSTVTVLINQAEAAAFALNMNGLLQTSANTTPAPFNDVPPPVTPPPFAPFGYVSICPAGEFSIEAPALPIYNFGTFPAIPHTGYRIFSFSPPVVAAGPVKFSTNVGSAAGVLAIDIGHVTLDCPPSIGVVSADNMLRIFKAN